MWWGVKRVGGSYQWEWLQRECALMRGGTQSRRVGETKAEDLSWQESKRQINQVQQTPINTSWLPQVSPRGEGGSMGKGKEDNCPGTRQRIQRSVTSSTSSIPLCRSLGERDGAGFHVQLCSVLDSKRMFGHSPRWKHATAALSRHQSFTCMWVISSAKHD